MRRFCTIQFGASFVRTRLRTTSDLNPSAPVDGDITPAYGGLPLQVSCSTDLATTSGLQLTLASLISDVKSLRQRWEREFRLCFSAESTVVVESLAAGETTWIPLTVLDATAVPGELVKAVNAALLSKVERQTGFNVIDMGNRAEAVYIAEQVLKEQFPSLRLNIDHSKGTDLQGVVTHTITASLEARGSPDRLSSEEKAIKNSFFGESIGMSYSGTVRRAVFEGFRAAGLPQPSWFNERNSGVSELSVYMDIIRHATGEEVSIVPVEMENDMVEISVRTSGGRQLSTLCGKRGDALSMALSCMEKAADIVNSVAAEGARKRIADHPVILTLPPKGIRLKDVLRRLLHHSFGVADDRVLFVTLRSTGGTFVTTINVELDWCASAGRGSASEGPETKAASPVVTITLATATGINKRAAEALASVSAIRECFARVFEEQLSFHPEVREVMHTTKATVNGSICPHVSRGIVEQLRWAARSVKKEIVFEVVQLLPNSENEALGIRTSRPLWATQLFMVNEDGSRDFVCLALDPKKSASEQKAVAIALFKHFREQCKDGVQYAMDQGLIDKDGGATSCDGMYSSTIPLPKSACELAAESDPFIQKLQLLPTQPIFVPPRQSALSAFRRGVQLYVDVLSERNAADSCGGPLRLVEDVQHLVDDGQFKAQLFTVYAGSNSDNTDHTPGEMSPLGEAGYSTTAISALFSAMKALFEKEGLIARAANDDSEVGEICLDTWRRVAALPSHPNELPTSTPLETVAQCVMTKYGLSAELRISGGGKAVNAQLYGRYPTSVADGKVEEVPLFFLGHGRGSSLLKAVVSCSRHVFSEHMGSAGHHLSVMEAGPKISGSVEVTPHDSGSLLALRIADVKKELSDNRAISPEASVFVRVDVTFLPSDKKYEASLQVVDGARSVELERVSPNADVMLSLLWLTESVGHEIGLPSIDRSAILRKCDDPRQLVVLKNFIRIVYGLPVVVETSMKGTQWYCHISVVLTGGIHYGIGYAVGKRKKDAVEGAAAGAMHRCLGTVAGLPGKDACEVKESPCDLYCGFVYPARNAE